MRLTVVCEDTHDFCGANPGWPPVWCNDIDFRSFVRPHCPAMCNLCSPCIRRLIRFCSARDRGAEYCDERVCVSVCVFVCLSAIISLELHDRSLPNFFVHVSYGRGSVRLWRRSDTLNYVLPVLWMTSCLLISQGRSTSTPS